MASLSPKKDAMEFDKAVEYMDPFEVQSYLWKTLNFLNRNNTECCFPNITPYIEAFLVGMASDPRNLKSKLLQHDSKELALDIIETLKLNRDVFRWTYAYGDGKLTKNLLVFKKIFTNKMKRKPKEYKLPTSTISQRLIQYSTQEQPQTQADIPTGCKIQMLNTTLRFLKNDAEKTLYYPAMPAAHAKFMCSLINNPENDINVGFGFKSLYAPLFEAMRACGVAYEFEITFDVAENNGVDTAFLKLQKMSRNESSLVRNSNKENSLEQSERNENARGNVSSKETPREESNNSLNTSLTSSTSSTRSKGRRRRSRRLAAAGVSPSETDTDFKTRALQTLLAFTGDAARASLTFEDLTDAEALFVKGVKKLANSTSSHGSLDASLRASLRQLDANIAEVMKTCKIRIEEGRTKDKARFITLKKVPIEDTSMKPLGQIKSKSSVSATSSENLIQFTSAGKLNSATGVVEPATDKPESATDSALKPAMAKDNLNKRQVKLLEAMSVPVESDKGKRMMELMGWAGGALGARGGGLLEPLLPAIDRPVGAGLGHVPPPKPESRNPEDFRISVLHNIHDLLLHSPANKLLEFKLPLSKKEKNFINAAITSLNKRKVLGLGVKAEQDLIKLLLSEMQRDRETDLKAEISHDLRKVNLTKFNRAIQKLPMKLQLKKMKTDHEPPMVMTSLNTIGDYELVDDKAIGQLMATVKSCKTPVAIRSRALRMLFIKRFINFVRCSREKTEFRFVGAMQKKLMKFLVHAVESVNLRARCSYAAGEEVALFEELLDCVEDSSCRLSIHFESCSKFVLMKMTNKNMEDQRTNSACPQAHDNNNNQQANNQIVNTVGKANDKVADNDTRKQNGIMTNDSPKHDIASTLASLVKTADRLAPKILQNDNLQSKEVAKMSTESDKEPNGLIQKGSIKVKASTNMKTAVTEFVDKLVQKSGLKGNDNIKMEIECDLKQANGLAQFASVKVKVLKTKTEHEGGLVQNAALNSEKVTKMEIGCDIENKEALSNMIIDKSASQSNVMQERNIDNTSDSSWSTCSDNELDISELDKDIIELDEALYEVGLAFNVNRESDTSVSPKTDSSSHSQKSTKRVDFETKSNILVIAPKSPKKEITSSIVRNIQTAILKEIDNEEYVIPLLKCHGIQPTGLVYSCHGDKDVAWLKKVINAANLDLEITKGTEDCIEDKKSRKMAVKINSFVTLSVEEIFSKIELYNHGVDTKPWKTLAYQLYSNYILLIVEVDELSYEYISEENFSLYMGIDKAQFSIIF